MMERDRWAHVEAVSLHDSFFDGVANPVPCEILGIVLERC